MMIALVLFGIGIAFDRCSLNKSDDIQFLKPSFNCSRASGVLCSTGGNAGELGDYKELAVLPNKIARYLYEYHADSYASHDLPVLPDDRSRTNVHGILKPHQVVQPR
jgi:hypothetical protein